jgi:metal-dependent hydrolase (beta-lactamase superfamily II)
MERREFIRLFASTQLHLAADSRARRLDALVLSHGHYDHFGGLAGFL